MTFDHLSYDSRDVTPSSLYSFKPEFLENAVKAGLSFLRGWKRLSWEFRHIVTDIKQEPVAQAFYQYPQDKTKIACLPGQRQTTAALLAFNILKQSHKPMLSTSEHDIVMEKTLFKSTLTTPESLDLPYDGWSCW